MKKRWAPSTPLLHVKSVSSCLCHTRSPTKMSLDSKSLGPNVTIPNQFQSSRQSSGLEGRQKGEKKLGGDVGIFR